MKVILIEDVKALGKSGDQVNVADGYARNFLIPRKLALGSSPANQAVYENEAKARTKKKSKEKADAAALGEKLGSLSLTIARMAGEDDKLFGSVTNADIAEALGKEGYKLDKRDIELPEHLKALGIFEVPVKLHPEVTVKVKVWVVKQGGEAAA
jgi:large subunit ribosomal protein L9